MSTSGDQYDRWKQATQKELQAFLKTAWKEPTPELRARYFASKKKVVMQLLEKARICLQGQTHEGFHVQNSTTNADTSKRDPKDNCQKSSILLRLPIIERIQSKMAIPESARKSEHCIQMSFCQSTLTAHDSNPTRGVP